MMIRLIALLALSALPLGCDRAAAERAPAGVAARVNGTQISLLAPGGALPGDQGVQQGVKAALDRAIDLELMAQRALREGLDRDPAVAAQVESARRGALAQAWLERRTAPAEATREEVKAFYDEHPALFAGRRLYRLRELAVSASPAMLEVLRVRAQEAASLDEVAAWLRSRNVAFAAATVAQPAEQLPLGHLPELARMQPGDVAVFHAPGGATVVQLIDAEDAPLGEAQAAALIQRFLAGRKRLQAAAEEAKRLRRAATIEYVGDFKVNSER